MAEYFLSFANLELRDRNDNPVTIRWVFECPRCDDLLKVTWKRLNGDMAATLDSTFQAGVSTANLQFTPQGGHGAYSLWSEQMKEIKDSLDLTDNPEAFRLLSLTDWGKDIVRQLWAERVERYGAN